MVLFSTQFFIRSTLEEITILQESDACRCNKSSRIVSDVRIHMICMALAAEENMLLFVS